MIGAIFGDFGGFPSQSLVRWLVLTAISLTTVLNSGNCWAVSSFSTASMLTSTLRMLYWLLSSRSLMSVLRLLAVLFGSVKPFSKIGPCSRSVIIYNIISFFNLVLLNSVNDRRSLSLSTKEWFCILMVNRMWGWPNDSCNWISAAQCEKNLGRYCSAYTRTENKAITYRIEFVPHNTSKGY